MINSLRDWLSNCEYFNSIKKLGVDFLSQNANTASIDKTPSAKTLETYVNGDSKCQLTFVLRAWFPYSDEARQNIENSEFLENLSDWVDEQTANENLPILSPNKTCLSIEVTTTDYLINVADNGLKGCYQLQLKMIYRKHKNDVFSQFYI